MIRTPNVIDRLYLAQGDEDTVYIDNDKKIPQQTIDGIRFLYKQFKRRKNGVILNDPFSFGRNVQICLFLKAVRPLLHRPILILCQEGSEMDWVDKFDTWTNESLLNEVAIETGRPDINKMVMINTMVNLHLFCLREWSIIIVDGDKVTTPNPILKLPFKACFKIWNTSVDVKNNLDRFEEVYKWLYPRAPFEKKFFVADSKNVSDNMNKTILIDTLCEDVVLRREDRFYFESLQRANRKASKKRLGPTKPALPYRMVGDTCIQPVRCTSNGESIILNKTRRFGDTTITPTKVVPPNVAPTNVSSTTIAPRNVGSTTITFSNVSSTNASSTTIGPTNVSSKTIASKNVGSTTITLPNVASTNVSSTTIAPTNVSSKTIASTNVGSTTITLSNVSSTIIDPTIVSSKTIASTNVGSTTITLSNVASTNVSSTIIDPTVVSSKTIASTNVGSTTITVSNVASTNVSSTTIALTNVTSKTIASRNVGSTTMTLSNVASTNVSSTTIAPTNVTSKTIASTNVGSTTITVSNVASTNVSSSTIPHTDVTSKTIASTNVGSTSITLSNVASTSVALTNLVSTSISLTNVASTSISPTKITPSIEIPSTSSGPTLTITKKNKDATGTKIKRSKTRIIELETANKLIKTPAGVVLAKLLEESPNTEDNGRKISKSYVDFSVENYKRKLGQNNGQHSTETKKIKVDSNIEIIDVHEKSVAPPQGLGDKLEEMDTMVYGYDTLISKVSPAEMSAKGEHSAPDKKEIEPYTILTCKPVGEHNTRNKLLPLNKRSIGTMTSETSPGCSDTERDKKNDRSLLKSTQLSTNIRELGITKSNLEELNREMRDLATVDRTEQLVKRQKTTNGSKTATCYGDILKKFGEQNKRTRVSFTALNVEQITNYLKLNNVDVQIKEREKAVAKKFEGSLLDSLF